jgi:uncharacterized membrane protein YfcA
MELLALAAWCFVVAFGGGLVGLVLGNLRLPVVLLLATSPAAGTGANIGISAVAAASASAAHVKAGRINWRLFAWMAPPSAAGAIVGGYLSGVIPGDALLIVIAAVLFYSAFELLRPGQARPARRSEQTIDVRAAVVTGFAIGVLGGVVGLILGSLRMPALLRIVGEVPARAVGTNVMVGFCVGVAGVVGHLPSAAPDWDLLAIGAGASIPAALLGSRLTGRLSEERLLQAIGGVLVVVGVSMIFEALT